MIWQTGEETSVLPQGEPNQVLWRIVDVKADGKRADVVMEIDASDMQGADEMFSLPDGCKLQYVLALTQENLHVRVRAINDGTSALQIAAHLTNHIKVRYNERIIHCLSLVTVA